MISPRYAMPVERLHTGAVCRVERQGQRYHIVEMASGVEYDAESTASMYTASVLLTEAEVAEYLLLAGIVERAEWRYALAKEAIYWGIDHS